MDDEGATTSAAPPHSFSHLGCVTAKRFSLRFCRMRSSACDTLSRSCARRVLCWLAFPSASALGSTDSAAGCPALFVGFPATIAESDFPRPFIIGYGSSPSRCGPERRTAAGQTSDLPVPVQGASAHARFFDHAGPFGPCDGASETCCLPRSKQRRHPGIGFRGSMAGLCPPLPTLRRRPYGRQRTARGRCGSLLLHRSGLAPPTPCRSPGALRVLHAQPGSPDSVGSSRRCQGARRGLRWPPAQSLSAAVDLF